MLKLCVSMLPREPDICSNDVNRNFNCSRDALQDCAPATFFFEQMDRCMRIVIIYYSASAILLVSAKNYVCVVYPDGDACCFFSEIIGEKSEIFQVVTFIQNDLRIHAEILDISPTFSTQQRLSMHKYFGEVFLRHFLRIAREACVACVPTTNTSEKYPIFFALPMHTSNTQGI